MKDSTYLENSLNAIDSLEVGSKLYYQTEAVQYLNWSPWVLLVASLSLIAAVIIPFIQELLKRRKERQGFEIFIKKKFGNAFNIITTEKIEYTEPSVKNEIKKELRLVEDVCNSINEDHKKHKSSVQPRIIFTHLMNIQNLMHFDYRLRIILQQIDFEKIKDQILEHGKNLSHKKRKEIYGLIMILESFISISLFHDKFGEFKIIKRSKENKIWIGLNLEKDIIKKQHLLNDDLIYLNDKESSLFEVINTTLIAVDQIKTFYDYYNIALKTKVKV